MTNYDQFAAVMTFIAMMIIMSGDYRIVEVRSPDRLRLVAITTAFDVIIPFFKL